MKEKKVRYYSSYTDDFEESACQDYKLPDDYKWVRKDFGSRLLSALVYALAIIFSGIYCKLFLHMKVKGRKKLKSVKGGFFIYGNHTQPVGDVFIPALCALPKRIYTVVSTANYGIPVIGKILPFLGALPIVENLHGIKELQKAIGYRIDSKNPVVIYPEAHVWKYYTEIRPFPATPFMFPVKQNKPAFAMTVTYRKSEIFKKPLMDVYLDGPFWGDGDTPREKAESLRETVYNTMRQRSELSNCAYIEYRQKTD